MCSFHIKILLIQIAHYFASVMSDRMKYSQQRISAKFNNIGESDEKKVNPQSIPVPMSLISNIQLLFMSIIDMLNAAPVKEGDEEAISESSGKNLLFLKETLLEIGNFPKQLMEPNIKSSFQAIVDKLQADGNNIARNELILVKSLIYDEIQAPPNYVYTIKE